MITANFIVANCLIGSGPLPTLETKLGQVERPCNTAYFCAACGEVWGRIVTSDKQDYTIKTRFCVRHGSGLFQGGTSPMWTYYPREVLIRELKLIHSHLTVNPSLHPYDLLFNWKRYYE